MIVQTVQATEYYVNAANGNDANTGTQSQPWKTIRKAANTLVNGDTVYIMAGTYTPTQQIEPVNSGTSGNYINYLAYPGDEHLVIIDGTSIPLTNWYGVISINSKTYIKVSGLKVINSSFAGIFVDESSNIIIENNYTYETHSSGISVWNSDTITIDNNEVVRACWPTDGIQECISISGSNKVLVKNNLVYNGGSIGYGGGGEGIDIKDGCSNTVVHDNLIHDIASVGIYIDAYATNQSNIHVYNNTVYNISGVGIAAASEEGGNLENVIINNNLVFSCEDRAMVIHWTNKPNYLIKNIYVVHNTFFGNTEGLDVGAHALGKNINIVNNIFSQNLVYQMQNSSNDLNLDELKIRNNLLYGDNPPWALFGDNYSTVDPEFIDSATNDFHLQSTSPAINQGTYLTKTVNTGTGTVISVEDAGFFTNGYGITIGDMVQFEGQTQLIEILAVDYNNNTITLAETVTWNIDDGIALQYMESAPDRGAFEYDTSLGVNNYTIDDLSIYPNPVKDILYVTDQYLNKTYHIISLTGKIIKSGKINTLAITVSKINSGVYLFIISDKTSNNKNITKLIKN